VRDADASVRCALVGLRSGVEDPEAAAAVSESVASDAVVLAGAILDALRARADLPEWRARQAACGQRVVERYGLRRMVDAYEALWRGI